MDLMKSKITESGEIHHFTFQKLNSRNLNFNRATQSI